MSTTRQRSRRTITMAGAGLALAFALHALVAVNPAAAAMDTPHSNNVTCGQCHTAQSGTWWTDQGGAGGVCGTCHNPAAPGGYPDAMPHKTTADYGSLTLQCSVCHDPHYQRQLRSWRTVTASNPISSYLTTGVNTGVTAMTLTKTGAGWDATANGGLGQWAGMILVPNTTYVQYAYKIASNTTDTITIDNTLSGNINLTYVTPNVSTFGITYGGFIKQAINARSVRFYRKTGLKSFADNDGVTDGVCQVCHLRTYIFNVNGVLNGGTHPLNKAETDCTSCHSHTNPDGGFLADCSSCHGSPPTNAGVRGGPDGLAEYFDGDTVGTGSNNAGKHLKHADGGAGNMGYECVTCHTGYVMPQDPAKTVDIGFSNFGLYQSGYYGGQTTVKYNGKNGTTVFNEGNFGDGNRNCNNIYCHSTVQSGADGTGAPTYNEVIWDSASAAMACGACHKGRKTDATTMDTGSHTPHLGISGVDCNTCHNNNTHVDGSIDVTSGTYTSGGAPQNGFGTCSSAACHDNGRGVGAVTPTWGQVVTDCSECHPKQPATGSHTTHLTGLTGFNRNALCADCHGDAVEGTTEPTGVHRDGDVDVFNDSNTTPNTDLGYLANVPKHNDNNFQSCSTAYCHSNGMNGTVLNAYKSATWGGGSTGCGFCHNALPATGAHAKHVKTAATSYGSTAVSTTGGSYNFGCGNCHPVDTANHMNGTLNITLNSGHGGPLKLKNNVADDTSGYSQTKGSAVTCSAAYCHSKGNGSFDVTSPNWYGTYSGDTCGHCHGNQPGTGAHAAHVVGIHYDNIYTGTTGLAAMGNTATGAHGNSATSTTISCNLCHNTTVNTANNDKNAVCAGCHGSSAPLMGNAAIAAGSGTHLNGQPDVAFATIQVRSKAQIRSDITTITELSDSWTRTGGYKAAGAYDVAKNALNTATMWTGGTKTCSNIACHNSRTVTWSGTLTCGSCHTALP